MMLVDSEWKKNEQSFHNSELLVETFHNTGRHIILNRPKQLNAIPREMFNTITNMILDWKQDSSAFVVISANNRFNGTGIDQQNNRAFCSGGDLKQITEYVRREKCKAVEFVRNEYRMNRELYRFEKPIIAIMDGYIMGGGCGVAMPATYRIVTENTVWAMPECSIGFHADVGANYYLSRVHHNIGVMLGLTGHRLNASDCMYCSLGTHFMQSANIPPFMNELANLDMHAKHKTAKQQIETLLDKYGTSRIPQQDIKLTLPQYEDVIERCFGEDNVEAIIDNLRNNQDHKTFTDNLLATLYKCSPTALKVTLHNIRTARNLNIEQCLSNNFNLSCNLFYHSNDFVEGVRALLIDKDRQPRWCPGDLTEVVDVESFFAPLPGIDELQFDRIHIP